jgi:hypothetical protein
MTRRFFFRSAVLALASLLLAGDEALAQEEYATRYEVGVQFSLLARHNSETRFSPFSERRENDHGFGGRFTYNVTKNIAFEAEVNSFPGELRDLHMPAGRFLQGQFGVKAGKRFKRFGLFGKLRPGFVRFTKVSRFTGSHEVVAFDTLTLRLARFQVPDFGIAAAAYSSVDVGGVIEFDPSRRIVTRLDLGDTIIRYGVFREAGFLDCPISSVCPPGDIRAASRDKAQPAIQRGRRLQILGAARTLRNMGQRIL